MLSTLVMAMKYGSRMLGGEHESGTTMGVGRGMADGG